VVERRCTVCGKPAVVEVPYARASFCKEHFLDFIDRKVRKLVKQYNLLEPGDRVVVSVSGGKDSATLAKVMDVLSKEIGFEYALLHIDLGLGKYSEKSREASLKLAEIL
jgi:tRNA(Ile)-lysidine synthase TilS/MesJ